MNHKGTKTMETERFHLRRFTVEDAEDFFQNVTSDPEVNRIEAGFDTNNPNSGRVMEKVGMKKEGIHRQARKNNQGLFDLVFYAILKEDWLELQGKKAAEFEMRN